MRIFSTHRLELLILETASKRCKYLPLGSKHCLSPEPGNTMEVTAAWHFYMCYCPSQPLRDHQLTGDIAGPICFPGSGDASRLSFSLSRFHLENHSILTSSSSPESWKTLWNRKGSLDIRMKVSPPSGWRRSILYMMGKTKARSEAVQAPNLMFPYHPFKGLTGKDIDSKIFLRFFKASHCTTLFFN